MLGLLENGESCDPIRVAFDVDGTLIHQVGEKADTPHYETIALFHYFEKIGATLYIWSGCGVDYATRWSDKLGLKATIIEKGSIIPDIAIDDMNVKLGTVNIQI